MEDLWPDQQRWPSVIRLAPAAPYVACVNLDISFWGQFGTVYQEAKYSHTLWFRVALWEVIKYRAVLLKLLCILESSEECLKTQIVGPTLRVLWIWDGAQEFAFLMLLIHSLLLARAHLITTGKGRAPKSIMMEPTCLARVMITLTSLVTMQVS